ncbi:MAG: type II toxin-antitoxin system RelE/ParE family toxin [Nanoarchaeota archaeon]|nr:type II toxin-antitoxin system RelE/ParE family toxin [Nanoarchaeota archaeon]
MVEVEFTKEFRFIFSKIKDALLKQKIINQIKKIKNNPSVGKPMKNVRKGTRELHVKPFRLSYIYYVDKDLVCLLDLYHKKKQ